MMKRYLFALFAIFTAIFQPIVPLSAQAMGWEEGSPQKIALHAAVGAAVAAVADGDVMAGAGAAALNEALLPHLTKALEEAGLDGVLDKVTAKGDKITLNTPKKYIDPTSYLQKEIDYLTKLKSEGGKGYKWVNQWSLKPGE